MTRSKSNRILSLLLALVVCSSIIITPASASTRATSIPTQYAPASWYGVAHQWTAKYYTYSSYIFEFAEAYGPSGNYVEVMAWAEKPFTLEIYRAKDNSLVDSIESGRTDLGQTSWAWFIETMEPLYTDDFYIVLRNNDPSTSISLNDHAFYKVTQQTKWV